MALGYILRLYMYTALILYLAFLINHLLEISGVFHGF